CRQAEARRLAAVFQTIDRQNRLAPPRGGNGPSGTERLAHPIQQSHDRTSFAAGQRPGPFTATCVRAVTPANANSRSPTTERWNNFSRFFPGSAPRGLVGECACNAGGGRDNYGGMPRSLILSGPQSTPMSADDSFGALMNRLRAGEEAAAAE